MASRTDRPADDDGLNFIKDEASDRDFFGSHDRVAGAMAEVIRRDRGLRIVGLLGPWGSGKSTVVRLMEAALRPAEPEVRIFYYDAWLHQSDPPKRSFLERFVNFLADAKLIEPEDWQEKLDVLNRRIEDNTVTTTPTLTVSGKFALASLVAVPFGARFIGNDWYRSFASAGRSSFEHWVFPAGVLLTFAPALAMALIYLFWRPARWPFSKPFWRRANWTTHRRPHEGQSLLALVVNRQIKEHRTRTIRTPEPSTIEFQSVFRELLAASAREEHRLVMIIDNLDRLPSDEGLLMWTTIRSFFLGAPGLAALDTDAFPTVILPLDETAVEPIFGGALQSAVPGVLMTAGQSFMDKTFDLTFHVTAPVLSDWHSYLEGQLRRLFGHRMRPEWPAQIGRIYARAMLGNRVTPRQVNRLVNDVGVLWMQWSALEIPFVSIAYFAVHRSYIGANVGQAFTNPLIDISDDDPNWQRSLAAMHFGVVPENALQVLIEPTLSQSIAQGDTAAFLSDSKLPGFPEVLVKLIDDANRPRPMVTNTALLLAGLDRDGAPWREGVWTRLRRRYLTEPLVQDLWQTTVPAFGALLSHCPDPELPSFVRSMRDALSQVDPIVCKLVGEAKAWAELIDRTFAEAERLGVDLAPIRIVGQGKEFLKVAAILGDDFPQKIASSAEPYEIVELFRAEVEGREEPELWLGKDRALVSLDEASGENVDWSRLVAAMLQVLENGEQGHAGLEACLWMLCRLSADHEAAAEALTSAVASTAVDKRFEQAIELNDAGLTATSAAALVLVGGDARAPGTTWEELLALRPQLVEAIDERLREFSDASSGLLVQASRSQPEVEPLSRRILARRLGTGSVGNLDVADVVEGLDAYQLLLSAGDRGRFISKLVSEPGFWSDLERRPIGKNEAELYRILISTDADPLTRQTARSSLQVRLRDVPEADWTDVISTNGPMLGLAIALRDALGRTPAVREPLFRALEGLIEALLSSDDEPSNTRWFSAMTLLAADFRRTLLKNVRDRLLASDAGATFLTLASTGGDALFDDGEFERKADDAVRHVVVPILDVPGGTEWIASEAARVRAWLSKASASTRGFFNEIIQGRIRSDEDGSASLLAVAAALGIDVSDDADRGD